MSPQHTNTFALAKIAINKLMFALKCVKAKSVFTKGERLEYNYRALSHFTISLSETESESAHTDETTTALDFYHSVSL